jgi:hypothetical protein
MEIIKLPPVLSEDLDLAAINQQLRDGTAKLDWSEVVSAQQKYLEVLLAGLDISNDSKALGNYEGSADALLDEINRFFESAKSKTKKPRPKKAKTSTAKSQESQQLSFLDTQFVTVENPEIDKQESLVKEQFVIKSDRQEDLDDINPEEFTTVLNKVTPSQIRTELETAIFNDLLGPAGGEEEEIEEDSVSDRYLVGLLAPLIRNKNTDLDKNNLEELPEQQDKLAIADKGNVLLP